MLDDIDNLLDDAINAHEAKDFNAAAIKYTKILEQDAHHADANHNFGLLTIELGFKDEALIFLQTAINTNPNVLQYWVTCLDTLINIERFYDAQSVLEKAHLFGYTDEVFEHLRHNLDLKQQQCGTLVKLTQAGDVKTDFDQATLEICEDGDGDASSVQSDGGVISNDKVSQQEEPPIEQIQSLMDMLSQQRFTQVYEQAQELTKQYSNNLTLWNIMGSAAAQNGQLDQAAFAFDKAINIEPSSADAHNNLGNVLLDQDKPEEAIQAFNEALTIKPDYAEAYYNSGNALQALGMFNDALEAYKKAISYKPDYADAYRGLSSVDNYKNNEHQLMQVESLLSSQNVTENAKCSLNFALAKMYVDKGELKKAFKCLSEGNSQRKRILKYSIEQDEKLFDKVKEMQPMLLKNTLKRRENSNDLLPIFIVGMPRSGTTLIEQIISSHSQVTGAGELSSVSKYGSAIATGRKPVNNLVISEFREKYLSEAAMFLKGNSIFTDKMPQNFRFIPLICAAFPEAKIIHVKRDAAATCWSNYKQYFVSKNIGYCYDLEDVTKYYKLYKNLMSLWQSDYSDRIYNLDYDQLTTSQEKETRKLINHLKIDWDEACISPHNNKRSVRTASQQQVREHVYQGSSEVWRKYEMFLNGAFDILSEKSNEI